MRSRRDVRCGVAPKGRLSSAVIPSSWLIVLAFLPPATGLLDLQAQEREFPGVELGLVYESGFAPAIAVRPFAGRFGGAAAAAQVEAIIARDLRYSDRYEVMDSIPPSLAGGEGIDYALWDRLGAVWLLNGSVEGSGGGGYVVDLQLHDVVYATVTDRGRFVVPRPDHPGFRMAVHRISDAVVEWTFGEPGMAASRIAFPMTRDDGQTKELYVIDSDGENLRRITNHESLIVSPAWSPDGSRIAFTSYKDGPALIYERDLATGAEHAIDVDREGMLLTPAYHPNGDVLAFNIQGGSRSGLFTYDVRRNCCLRNITEGRRIDISPSYSPDGRRLAFNSNRYGDAVPQIFVMSADGGDAELISPYRYGQQGYYTSPDWSPQGDLVAFHGRIERYGMYQILVARMDERGRLLQLTSEGNNEDPSWAPDGRHLVFRGDRSWGRGLFVVDTGTGAIRVLASGVDVSVPDWSPGLTGG
jgi:TolB protein